MGEIQNDFTVFVPVDFKKSEAAVGETVTATSDASQGDWYACGFASTPVLDLQDDIVDPHGIDISYFAKHGWITYEHKQDAKYIIGVPTENCYVDLEKGLYVEAKLMKDNIYAQEMWQLAEDIKNSGINRSLGYSIEGAIRGRSSENEHIVTDVFIKNVTLTTHPANVDATWETVIKSWTTGYEVGGSDQKKAGALRREHLARSVVMLAGMYTLPTVKETEETWDDICAIIDKQERVTPELQQLVLQLSKGISREEAKAFIERRKGKPSE